MTSGRLLIVVVLALPILLLDTRPLLGHRAKINVNLQQYTPREISVSIFVLSTLLRAIFCFGSLSCFCCSFFFTLIPRRAVLNHPDMTAEDLRRTERQSGMTWCWIVPCDPVRRPRHLFDRWLSIPCSRVINTSWSRVCLFNWDTSLPVNSRYKRRLPTSRQI